MLNLRNTGLRGRRAKKDMTRKGFTLIELLVAITIIIFLVMIVFVAIKLLGRINEMGSPEERQTPEELCVKKGGVPLGTGGYSRRDGDIDDCKFPPNGGEF